MQYIIFEKQFYRHYTPNNIDNKGIRIQNTIKDSSTEHDNNG